MKSPIYVLSILLPFAAQVAEASPVAEPDIDSLEVKNKDKDHHGRPPWDDHDHHRSPPWNPCEVKDSYPYYKYPCQDSPETGNSIVGATFTSSCKYRNWYFTPRGWVKEDDKPRKCAGSNEKCP